MDVGNRFVNIPSDQAPFHSEPARKIKFGQLMLRPILVFMDRLTVGWTNRQLCPPLEMQFDLYATNIDPPKVFVKKILHF